MSPDEQEELNALRRKMYSCSGGDRPHSPAAATLKRLIELEGKEIEESTERLFEGLRKDTEGPAPGLLTDP